MNIKIKKLHEDAVIPRYQTFGASGFDFHALEDVSIFPGETKLVKTGLAFSIPLGYELQVRPRSGTSFKTFLRIANAPGTVDSDYRGEVCAIITNINAVWTTANSAELIKKGDRIAQGVICPVIQAEFELVDDLDDTQRGSGAWGSTGI